MAKDKDMVFKTQTKSDGTTHEYFNRGSQDGDKHGHRVTDSKSGKEHYVRDSDDSTYDVIKK